MRPPRAPRARSVKEAAPADRVQKVLAAVDWFASEAGTNAAPIGVMGYGEGGLIATNRADLAEGLKD